MPPAASCPACGGLAVYACECPLRHSACKAWHHWHRHPDSGLTVVDRAGPGRCLPRRESRYDAENVARALFQVAAARVVDAVLADLDARGLLLAAPPAEVPLRDELARLVARVLRGGRPRKPRPLDENGV